MWSKYTEYKKKDLLQLRRDLGLIQNIHIGSLQISANSCTRGYETTFHSPFSFSFNEINVSKSCFLNMKT